MRIAELSDDGGPAAEFVRLFTRHQRRLFVHILAQVGHPVDADEVLQETNLILWKKSSDFIPGTNFLAWALRVADLEVLRFRAKQRRDKLVFSDEFLELVTAEAEQRSDLSEQRRLALAECLRKLRPADRELITARYSAAEDDGHLDTGRELAERLDRPANSVYQSLGRIRRALLTCIERRLTTEPS